MSNTIRCEVDADGIATLWFNEPGKSVNTLPTEVLAELSQAIDRIEREAALRGVIFASEKPTTFIAGADLKKVRAMTRTQLDRYIIDGQQLFDRIERLGVVTAAAINGHCLGGGLELALSCRVRIAADNPTALIGLPETAIGLIPGWGGTVRLPRLIGYAAATPLLLESRKISPQEALRLGIVDEVVAPGELLPRARAAVVQANTNESSARQRPGALMHAEGACERNIREIAADVQKRLPSLALSPMAVTKLTDVLLAGCRGGIEAGLKTERDVASELFDGPECREWLDRFFARK